VKKKRHPLLTWRTLRLLTGFDRQTMM